MRDVPLPRLVGFVELSFPFSHHLVCVAFLHGDLGYKKFEKCNFREWG
jgi:hypothetical protein